MLPWIEVSPATVNVEEESNCAAAGNAEGKSLLLSR